MATKIYTLEEIQKLDETRRATVAHLMLEDSKLAANREKMMAQKQKAVDSGDIDAAAAALQQIKDIDNKREALAEIIDAENARATLTDEEIGRSMNAVTVQLRKDYAALEPEYKKAKNALLTVYNKYLAMEAATRDTHDKLIDFMTPAARRFGRNCISCGVGIETLPDIPDAGVLEELSES